MWQDILEVTDKYFQAGLVGFLITAVIIIAVVLILKKVLRKFFSKMVILNRMDETGARFTGRMVFAIVYTFAIFGIVLQVIPLRNVSVSLLAGSGVAVLVIGFAAQEAFSNIIAGFFISFFRPFSVEDLVSIPSINVSGRVEDINLRHTIIRTFSNHRVIVPNSTMNTAVIENQDIQDRKTVNFFKMSISYKSDIDKARQIMIEEASKHPNLLDTRTEQDKHDGLPLVRVILINLGDFSVDLRASLWSEDSIAGWVMLNDLREAVKKRFDAEGVDIPFPSHNIYMQK